MACLTSKTLQAFKYCTNKRFQLQMMLKVQILIFFSSVCLFSPLWRAGVNLKFLFQQPKDFSHCLPIEGSGGKGEATGPVGDSHASGDPDV